MSYQDVANRLQAALDGLNGFSATHQLSLDQFNAWEAARKSILSAMGEMVAVEMLAEGDD